MFKKKVKKSEMQVGRGLIKGVVDQFSTWHDQLAKGINNLVSHANENTKLICKLNEENGILQNEIAVATSFKDNIGELMAKKKEQEQEKNTANTGMPKQGEQDKTRK